ncbi:hypothetical protein BKA19_0249 [Blastococcus saxobsidens]|uniref:Uncharacterized protein n=1 Tax=Blastococcus saxobsidens TaxID=138336 RepID=A0A4Q7Y484_9ACTN|nr:hypothetical protein BKA19_0249 [Blastococcus saxobsidens]
MLRTPGRRYVKPDVRRFTVSLSNSEMHEVDMLCAVMNVGRSELFQMLLANIRTNHQGEKE